MWKHFIVIWKATVAGGGKGGRCCVWELVNLGFEHTKDWDVSEQLIEYAINSQPGHWGVRTATFNSQQVPTYRTQSTLKQQDIENFNNNYKNNINIGHRDFRYLFGEAFLYCLSSNWRSWRREWGGRGGNYYSTSKWKFKGKASQRNACWTPLRSGNIPITTESSCLASSENK